MPPVTWFVPGRIEVLGKHTDYAGGRSMLAAVDRGVTVTATESDEDAITVSTDAAAGVHPLRAGVDPHLPDGHWANYAQTVIDRLTQNFGRLRGATVEVTSSLPLASGMSSSSALICSIALALADLNGFTATELWTSTIRDRVDLAGYLACVENGMSFGPLTGHRGVGTFGGSEDHTAMLCSEPNTLGVFSFCPIRRETTIAFPDEVTFVVLVSGVAAEKTGAARDDYNRAAFATREIVERWNRAQQREDAVLADALHSSPQALDQLTALVADDPLLSKRLTAFVRESEQIIPAAQQAFADSHWARFGALVADSQAGAEHDLGNQVPQTVDLVRLATRRGAWAASSFGAGFGGSVWALVPTADAEAFGQGWLADYAEHFPTEAAQASVIVTRPGTPAERR